MYTIVLERVSQQGKKHATAHTQTTESTKSTRVEVHDATAAEIQDEDSNQTRAGGENSQGKLGYSLYQPSTKESLA